jgi:hypothetical protein
MNKPSGSKPKPNPAPPAKNRCSPAKGLSALEERVYDLEAQMAALLLERDKEQPVRSTNNERTGINVTKAELTLIVQALKLMWNQEDMVDVRQEQAEWFELTVNRFTKMLEEWT